jgi:glycosyltransferase involved in cell wall biosynthesis
MDKKICLIYNFAQHYRKEIFMLMDKALACDFIFGDKMGDVKKLDYTLLLHFKKEVENKIFIKKPLYWQKGVLPLLKEDYTHYIVLGEVICISTWLMVWGARLKGKKIYLWAHGWYGKESKIRTFITKNFSQRFATGFFLYGNYARNLMIKGGLNPQKLHVIYNSLAYDEQLAIRNNLKNTNIYKTHFRNDCPNLIFVGRVTKVKQLDLLLHALFELNRQGLKYNLTFIGNGEVKQELSGLAKKLSVEDHVWFYGATYNESELSELIYNASLCVSPGNVGLTAIHAMNYGCPVVTHDNFAWQMPEFEAIEKDKTGDFFQQNNTQSLVETIQKWFLKNLDRKTIREKCYEIIDTKYNPHKQLETIKAVLMNE